MLQRGNAQLLYDRKCIREQKLQKQPKSLHPEDSQDDAEAKSQPSSVITAGFVKTHDRRFEVQSCEYVMCAFTHHSKQPELTTCRWSH